MREAPEGSLRFEITGLIHAQLLSIPHSPVYSEWLIIIIVIQSLVPGEAYDYGPSSNFLIYIFMNTCLPKPYIFLERTEGI